MMIKFRELLEESKVVKSQKDMIAIFQKTQSDLFKKSGSFDARKGQAGEHISTVIDGEHETQKTVKENEVVVKGPKGEMYVISNKVFNDRYEVEKELTDEYQKYKAKGFIRAYEYTGPTIKFIASWDEEMLCKKGDYLATPVKDSEDVKVTEVYRIERSVFNSTYTKV